jgi:hypothetical protein
MHLLLTPFVLSPLSPKCSHMCGRCQGRAEGASHASKHMEVLSARNQGAKGVRIGFDIFVGKSANFEAMSRSPQERE